MRVVWRLAYWRQSPWYSRSIGRQKLFVPLLLGIFFAYTLSPLVSWLERIRVPRVLGTSMVMTIVVCTLVMGSYSLRGQMQTILVQLPEAASKLSEGFASMRDDPSGNMQKMQTAMGEMEKATSQVANTPSGGKHRTPHVVIDTPGFMVGDIMWASSMGALGFIGQAAMVIFLCFFLLVGGDTFKRKLVRLAGPSLSRKKITVAILDDINGSIQKYMFMLLMTNILLGLLIWIAFRWIGLENAGAWAVTAGLLHVIPYLGPLAIAAATGMAAYHAIRLVFDGVAGLGGIIGDRHGRRHLRDHLDNRENRQNECGGRVHFTAVLGLAVGRVGHAARHPDHRYPESSVPACGTNAACGGVAGRIKPPGKPAVRESGGLV